MKKLFCLVFLFSCSHGAGDKNHKVDHYNYIPALMEIEKLNEKERLLSQQRMIDGFYDSDESTLLRISGPKKQCYGKGYYLQNFFSKPLSRKKISCKESPYSQNTFGECSFSSKDKFIFMKTKEACLKEKHQSI